ncbi:MAG TPA: serine hydrolase domain-containing protein [Solirubrobacteraceae bacterium]|nr:serine hydrolase domain-containing protein [Solirubrobacteraceae bacterium]
MRFAAAVLALAVATAGCGGSDDRSAKGTGTPTPSPEPEPTAVIEEPGTVERGSQADALKAVAVHARKLEDGDAFSGAVLVAKDGRVLFKRAYGMADREQGVPNTLRTRFRIGSMNKMITAVATLQLVEAGKLDLDGRLVEYLPDYPNRNVARKVTIHHLLTHTSGNGDIFGAKFEENRDELRAHADYVELYGKRTLGFEPGDDWRYSNYGFILLGVVIERVSGQSYYEYVQEHIYERAGMSRSGSEPESEEVVDRSVGYMKPPGETEWSANTDTLPYRGTSAGGGYSTVGDLARFGDALLRGELLSPRSTKLLITGKTEPLMGPGFKYAYGFFDARLPGGTGWVGHGGGAPGMNGDLRIYPKTGYVVTALANLDPPAADQVTEYLDRLLPREG